MDKKKRIEEICNEMLENSMEAMKDQIQKALHSGALDVDNWNENYNPMIIPKTIMIAVLKNEAEQYSGKGTSFEKQINRDVKNLINFI